MLDPRKLALHHISTCMLTLRLSGRFLTTTLILGKLGSSGGNTIGEAACGDMASDGDCSLYPLCGVPA